MGGELVRAAYAALWFEDQSAARHAHPAPTMNERAVLIYVCSIAHDSDTPPRYWGGRDAIARYALGRIATLDDSEAAERSRRSIYESVRQALEPLVAWGALERIGGSYPGRQQEYAIRVRELLTALQSEQATLGPSARSPWAIRKQRLSKGQAPIGPKTKDTKNTKRDTPDHLPAPTHLSAVDNREETQIAV